MSGYAIAVLGPSGAGKDSLINGICNERPDIYKVRRVITRSEAVGGEDFEGVSHEQFLQLAKDGAFCLQWEAHGNKYGIPKNVRERLENGENIIFNGSRTMHNETMKLFSNFVVLNVHVPSDVLASRLTMRGREKPEDVEKRLERAKSVSSPLSGAYEIDNSGSLESAINQALHIIDRYLSK